MGNFKPQVSFCTEDSIREWYKNDRKSRMIINVYPTYVKLKKSIGER
jgi:hypothetical protein